MLLYAWTMDAAAAVVEAFNVVGCKKWLMLIVAENRELSNRWRSEQLSPSQEDRGWLLGLLTHKMLMTGSAVRCECRQSLAAARG